MFKLFVLTAECCLSCLAVALSLSKLFSVAACVFGFACVGCVHCLLRCSRNHLSVVEGFVHLMLQAKLLLVAPTCILQSSLCFLMYTCLRYVGLLVSIPFTCFHVSSV